MNKEEIKRKVEEKRNQIREEADKIKKESAERGICPNCGTPLPNGRRRTYCSVDCSIKFYYSHDYSRNSAALKEYRRKLMDQNEKNHSGSASIPYRTARARNDYRCDICGSEINKGEQYSSYTILPQDPQFLDYPYGVRRYHKNCFRFLTVACSVLDTDDGLYDDEIEELFRVCAEYHKISVGEMKNRILDGDIPTKEEWVEIEEKIYEAWGVA